METFGQIRAGRFVWLATTLPFAAPKAELQRVLENPEAFLNDRTRLIKSSRVVTIARVPPNLILRRLNYGKIRHRLRDCVRPSRAVRALVAGTWLDEAGIRTPRAIAAADVRFLRWPRAAYLITEEVPDAQTLASFFAFKGRVPLAIADMIAHLHNSGLSHQDLKWTNILLDAQLSPWLIDLDGVLRLDHVPDERAQEDLWTLARCFAPFPTALKWSGARFLRRYCALRKRAFKPWAIALLRRLQSGSGS